MTPRRRTCASSTSHETARHRRSPRLALSWATGGRVRSARTRSRSRHANGEIATTGRRRLDRRRSSGRGRSRRSRSREAADVRVRAVDADGTRRRRRGATPLRVEAGLARRVGLGRRLGEPVDLLRRTTARGRRTSCARSSTSVGAVRRARVYATAHGVYELEVNGGRVSRRRARARVDAATAIASGISTHDVTALARPTARNAVGAWLADGWYRGRLGFNGGLWDNYGTDVALLLQLEVDDDRRAHASFRSTGRGAPSPIVATGLYEGETHDARLEQPRLVGARTSTPTAGRRPTACPRRRSRPTLEAPTGPPVRVIETLAPGTVERRPDGRILLDFGQNISGKLRITVAGRRRARRSELHHAEVLEDGELAHPPAALGDIRSTRTRSPRRRAGRRGRRGSRSTASGTPRSAAGRPSASLRRRRGARRPLRHARAPAGSSRAHPLLDRFHENVVWSMRDNFVDLPDRLPAARRAARLERRHPGVRARRRAYLYDATGVLAELAARPRRRAARSTARCSNFHPWIECGFPNDPDRGLGRCRGHRAVGRCTVARGDLGILRDQFDSMRAWVDQVFALTGQTGHWNTGFQLGDWLDPAAPPDRPGDSRTDRHLVATAYHAHTARRLAETAHAARRRRGCTQRLRRASPTRAVAAFQDALRLPSGRVVSDTVDRALASRSSSTCSTATQQRERAGSATGANSSRDGDHPHPDRLRRHADRLRRARAHRTASTTPTTCCCSTERRRGCTP